MQSDPKPGRRIETIDLARGLALIAMASYHFTWDLEFFGYAEPGLTAVGGWKIYARCIASSLLFLAGVSLVLAHGNGIRWPGFWKRFAMVAGAAALISLVTYFAVPGGFIFFGILHQIALASLLGLAFLRLPWWATLLAAAAVIAAPFYLRSEMFDHPALWWVGLSTVNPRSNDYVPLFPWFGPVLIGIAAAKLASSAGLFERLKLIRPGSWSGPLRFAGRHSLAFYLIHQPVLIGLVWLASQVIPVSPQAREASFIKGCERQCADVRDATFCTAYCGCVLDKIDKAGMLEKVFAASSDAAVTDKVLEAAAMCTVETDDKLLEGTTP